MERLGRWRERRKEEKKETRRRSGPSYTFPPVALENVRLRRRFESLVSISDDWLMIP